MTPDKFIDVEKVLREKAPGLKKWMPRFVLNWLKRKLHEGDINEMMIDLKDIHGVEFNRFNLSGVPTSVHACV